MQKFNVNQFDHSADTKAFTAELSELEPIQIGEPLTLCSDMGCEATFEMVDAGVDQDHDFQYWKYQPTAETVGRIGRLKDYTLTIFND